MQSKLEAVIEQVGRRRQGNRADRQSLEVKVDLKVSVAQKESPEASDDNRLALGLIRLQRIRQQRLRLVSFHSVALRTVEAVASVTGHLTCFSELDLHHSISTARSAPALLRRPVYRLDRLHRHDRATYEGTGTTSRCACIQTSFATPMPVSETFTTSVKYA